MPTLPACSSCCVNLEPLGKQRSKKVHSSDHLAGLRVLSLSYSGCGPGVLLLVHCFLSMMVHQAVGVAAKKVDKEPVSGELEFTIHSSLIFASSIGHIVAATVGIWVVGSGMNWSRGRDGFAGACYIAGLLAAISSGALATNVSSQHLFEKREGLVRLTKTGIRK